MIIRTLSNPTGFRWGGDAFGELERRMREFQHLFDSLNDERRGRAGVFPPVNIEEDSDHFYVSAELPGMDPKDIALETVNNSLTIGGQRTIAKEGENVSYHRREREAGAFRRSIAFPTALDPEKIEATYNNGVLMVTLAKAEEAKPRQIQVQAS